MQRRRSYWWFLLFSLCTPVSTDKGYCQSTCPSMTWPWRCLNFWYPSRLCQWCVFLLKVMYIFTFSMVVWPVHVQITIYMYVWVWSINFTFAVAATSSIFRKQPPSHPWNTPRGLYWTQLFPYWSSWHKAPTPSWCDHFPSVTDEWVSWFVLAVPGMTCYYRGG